MRRVKAGTKDALRNVVRGQKLQKPLVAKVRDDKLDRLLAPLPKTASEREPRVRNAAFFPLRHRKTVHQFAQYGTLVKRKQRALPQLDERAYRQVKVVKAAYRKFGANHY